ncbi:MAG: glycosyltransferase family 2 protein [Elusimicrobia bacterium]|nr:glycosyltransferase family 2 protein [Elusimicrobiota bacterium]
MKVSGFTFVKDAEKYDFPVLESIKSMLPLCDEVIVNVGISEDNTLRLVKSIGDAKIRIIETVWDEKLKVKQRILAQQTNISLYKCTGDWCLYLQGDEVLHEDDYDAIMKTMRDNLEDKKVEGLLFDYNHFFGSYDTYINSYHWYRKEIRVIRNHLGITSWRDAQGFRVDGKKLHVKGCPARVYHYGWVRDPAKMKSKKKYQKTLHHGNGSSTREYDDRFHYEEHIDPFLVGRFRGSHPGVMSERISQWKYPFEPGRFRRKLSPKDIRHRITEAVSRITGIKIGEYRNYILLKD